MHACMDGPYKFVFEILIISLHLEVYMQSGEWSINHLNIYPYILIIPDMRSPTLVIMIRLTENKVMICTMLGSLFTG